MKKCEAFDWSVSVPACNERRFDAKTKVANFKYLGKLKDAEFFIRAIALNASGDAYAPVCFAFFYDIDCCIN